MKKIGIMGGTFDPVHIGHLVLAEEIRDKLALDKIVFIPTGNPPHKRNKKVTDASYRYKMVELAIEDNKSFEISDMEIKRVGTSYTVDTIRELKESYKEEAEFFFITGADAIIELSSWKSVDEILKMCKFVAATRPGFHMEDMERAIEALEYDCRKNIEAIPVAALRISSTDIRKRIKENRTIKYLVPKSVEEYIYQNKLYLD